ncbi:GH32 C-terminal domain-containing protein [Litoribacter populi]|uniref:GH32 C-terminal domain-containing protein n=1 Tax=Litoribacter populi TaxID=2598460 RepID=UPI00117EC379|nr:GH32 C-terminal domain-containing protein [Litoribacter populi]
MVYTKIKNIFGYEKVKGPGFARLLFLFFILCIEIAEAADPPFMHFRFDEEPGVPFAQEEFGNQQFPIHNLFSSPPRIPGLQGNALRFDGYSTYVEKEHTINSVTNQMTIEAWYATEAFSPSTDLDRNPIEGGAIISQIDQGSGFALKIGPYGNVILDFFANGNKHTIATSQMIQKYAWNHIMATIDLSTQNAQIFVNGTLWKSLPLEEAGNITFANVPMRIGQHNSSATIEGFNINTLNGAIDDLKIYNVALTAAEALENYTRFAPAPQEEIIFEDFEREDYGDWAVEGTAFGASPASGTLPDQMPVTGYMGSQLANSFHNGDTSTGKLTSPSFTIQYDLINFLVGGGNHPGRAEVRLVIDGHTVRSATGNNTEHLRFDTWAVEEFLGSNAHIEIVDQETGGWGHILADHFTFSNKQELVEADLSINPAERHGHDYLRPQFHPMPNTSWTNEAYGLTYYNGKYHLFFQKNPNGPYLFFMHWGHLTSTDMVHWQEEKIALAPSSGFDDFGIWSGTTIMDQNNEPVIFYTGVNVGRAAIGLARPNDDDLIEWEKHSENPVIPQSPPGLLDFRDPFLWEDNGIYYMIVGSGQANNGGGTIPTYKSTDLLNWTKIPDLYSNPNIEETGFFWEMPLFYPINDEGDYILSVTPLFPDKPANVVYWIGKFENEKFVPNSESAQLLEPVRDNMLAPAIGSDELGRVNYIGIIPETRNVPDQLKAGWRHAFALPRVIRLLEDNKIGHYPHPNLCRLRSNEISIEDRIIEENTENNLIEFGGNQSNLIFSVKAEENSRFALQLLKNADGSQHTSIIFDLERNQIALDTRYSHEREASRSYKTFEYVFDHQEEINLEIFIDRSIVEVFIDNLLVISTRSYPSEASQLVDLLVTQGEVVILDASQYDMQAIGSPTGIEVCEPGYLPTGFRSGEEDIITSVRENENLRKHIKVYPNPASTTLQVDLSENLGAYELSLYSTSGTLISSDSSEHSQKVINVEHLQAGIYVVVLRGKSFMESYKVIINR